MSRYIDTLIVTFTDGSTQEVSANRARVHDGVLTVTTENNYGMNSGTCHFSLVNVRSWRWKDGQP